MRLASLSFVLAACVGMPDPRVDQTSSAVSIDGALQLETGGLVQYSVTQLGQDTAAIDITCRALNVADPQRTAMPGSASYPAVVVRGLPRAAAEAIAAAGQVQVTARSGFDSFDHSSFWIGIDGFGSSDVVPDGNSYPAFVVSDAAVTFHCAGCN